MAERLRRKFILVAMGSILIVMLLMAGMIHISSYRQIHQRADELLQVLADNDGRFPMEASNKEGKVGKENKENKNGQELPFRISKEAPFSTRFFSVKADTAYTVTAVDTGKISAISTDEAIVYGEQVLSSAKETGLLDHYKFLKANKDYGTLVVFVDCSRDLQFFYDSLKTSVAICFIGIVGVFLLIFLLSKRAVAPIVESYEKQKEFITNVSHELKTPLAIIKANTEVLEMETGESQWTESIHHQVGRLQVLVGGLISLSRMEEAGVLLEKEEIPLSQVAEEMVEHFQALALQVGKTLEIHIEENLRYVGNEEALRQLLSCVLDNAVKYAVAETAISFGVKKQGKRIEIEIKNQGEGLEIGRYDHLLQRFYRREASRNSQTGGNGIGLSVAKSIVQGHKGKISAQSPDGKWLVFTILL